MSHIPDRRHQSRENPLRSSRSQCVQPNDILIRFPIDLHLAPRPAHNVLAHSTPEEPEQRAFHPPRVGPDRYTEAISASAFLVSRW